MKAIIVGTGNVAWHLAKACTAAGHELIAVVSRSASAGNEFIKDFPETRSITLAEMKGLSPDIVLLTVPDSAIEELAPQLDLDARTVVAHTSGSQPLSALNPTPRAGVFYPVQTFTKYKPLDLANVPILVEGQDKVTEELLVQLACSLSRNVHVKDSAARKQLHLAAVFACNFTNHLLGISRHILQKAALPEHLLQPLIQETLAKASSNDPFSVQTGPAYRNDTNVIQEHLQQLSYQHTWQQLYRQLTQSIQEQKAGSTDQGSTGESTV